MTECKHEWRLILDDTGGAFRFCSICEQSENEWMNAKPKQCKDCKYFVPLMPQDMRGECAKIVMVHRREANTHPDWAMAVAGPDGYGLLYVLPTHGCNAWEAKGQKE